MNMNDILEFVEKRDDKSLRNKFVAYFGDSFDENILPLYYYTIRENDLSLPQKIFCDKCLIKYSLYRTRELNEYENEYDHEFCFKFDFDKVKFNTSIEIEKSVIITGLLFHIYKEEEGQSLFPNYGFYKFVRDFNTINIFGNIEMNTKKYDAVIEGNFLYSSSPVINKAINEINDNALVLIIQTFTNATAMVNQTEKVEATKSLSRMIDVDSKAFVSDKKIHITKHGNKESAIYRNIEKMVKLFDDICNNSKINHPEKDNTDFTNKELEVTFDLGLSVMRYLESLKNIDQKPTEQANEYISDIDDEIPF